MLHEQTIKKLLRMKLNGMAEAFEEQCRQAQARELSFEERFSLLVERQWLWKENRSLATRLKYARLKQTACIEDIDFRHPRGLKRALLEGLVNSQWVQFHQNCTITGPTGVGKSFLACALAQKACRDGYRVLYCSVPKLFRELSRAHADGSLPQLLKKLARTDVLVLDDWGLGNPKRSHYRDFLEILEDRSGSGSTLITSQLPVSAWHDLIDDATVADAILDRLVHQAHNIELKGESLRKTHKALK